MEHCQCDGQYGPPHQRWVDFDASWAGDWRSQHQSVYGYSDRFVFVGDYFDSFVISGVEQIQNFKDIIEFKKNSDKEVILLLGNHDHHYMSNETYSGFQPYLRWDAESILRENLNHLQIAFSFDNILCSHAGISPVWLDNHIPGWKKETMVDDINDLYRYTPTSFNFTHGGTTHMEITQHRDQCG